MRFPHSTIGTKVIQITATFNELNSLENPIQFNSIQLNNTDGMKWIKPF